MDSAPAVRVGLPVEVTLVWLLFTLVTVEIFVTYSRVPASGLYHVSGSGLEGGASRALVFTNFPTALVALALLALLYERLPTRLGKALAVLAAVLCAAVVWPGVVSQANLDAKPVNAIAALGVLLTLGLTVTVARRNGLARRPWHRADGGRLTVTLLLVLLSLPWLAADLGFFLNGVPVLGRIFQTGEYGHRAAGLPPFPPAVHHGHHHGMDGLLLVLSALLLSRAQSTIRALPAYLALMFCYGVGNIANDFWTEQVFKRGWTTWQIPNVLEPRLTVAWGVIVLAASTLWWLARRRSRDAPAAGQTARA